MLHWLVFPRLASLEMLEYPIRSKEAKAILPPIFTAFPSPPCNEEINS